MRKHRTCDHYEQATISLPSKPSRKDRTIALDKYVFGDFRYTKKRNNSQLLGNSDYSEFEESFSSITTSDDENDHKSKTKKKNVNDDTEGPPTDLDSEGPPTDTDSNRDDNETKDTSNLNAADQETEQEKKRYRVIRPLWYDSKRRSSSSEDAEFVYDLDEEEEEEEESESESSEEESSHGEFDEEVWRFAKLTREIEKQNKAEEERLSKRVEEVEYAESRSNKQLEVRAVSKSKSYPEASPDLQTESQIREPRIETVPGPSRAPPESRPQSRQKSRPETPQKSRGSSGKSFQLEQESKKDPRISKRAQSRRRSRSRSKSRSRKRCKSRERVLRRKREMDMHRWWFYGLGYDMECRAEKSYSWILGPTTNDVVLDIIATFMQLFGAIIKYCGCVDDRESIREIASRNVKTYVTKIMTPAPDKKSSAPLKPKPIPPVTDTVIPSTLEAEPPATESTAPTPAVELPTPPLITRMPTPSVDAESLTKPSQQSTPNLSQELGGATPSLETELPTLILEEKCPTPPKTPNPSEEPSLEEKCPTPPLKTPNTSKEISSKDVRPGLIQDRSKQRLVEIEKRKAASDEENKKRHKSQASLEVERREKGLQEAIPADNKGFEILQKMGYKPGEAIGKTAKGPIVPVKIEVKGDRSGLGRKSSTKLIMEPKHQLKKTESLEGEVTTEDFRKRITSDVRRRHAEADLVSSQRACYNLDLENGYDEPLKKFYWPVEVMEVVDEALKDYGDQVYGGLLKRKKAKKKDSKAEDGAEDEDIGTYEKLAELTDYLRNTYYYCVWCGATYSGKSDIAKYCPGPSRELH